MKLTVVNATPSRVEFTTESNEPVTAGHYQQPGFFDTIEPYGLKVAKVKNGQVIEIPDEALDRSKDGRLYFVGEKSVEQLQKTEVRQRIAINAKKLELIAEG